MGMTLLLLGGSFLLVRIGFILVRTSAATHSSRMDNLLMASQFMFGVKGFTANATGHRRVFHFGPPSGFLLLFGMTVPFARWNTLRELGHLNEGRTYETIGYTL